MRRMPFAMLLAIPGLMALIFTVWFDKPRDKTVIELPRKSPLDVVVERHNQCFAELAGSTIGEPDAKDAAEDEYDACLWKLGQELETAGKQVEAIDTYEEIASKSGHHDLQWQKRASERLTELKSSTDRK